MRSSGACPAPRNWPGHIRYALKRWNGLTRFLDDGRIEMDTNPVENAIRPIPLTRKNALFVGNDDGAKTWARCALLLGTCKLNGVNPQTYMTVTLRRIVDMHPMSQVGIIYLTNG